MYRGVWRASRADLVRLLLILNILAKEQPVAAYQSAVSRLVEVAVAEFVQDVVADLPDVYPLEYTPQVILRDPIRLRPARSHPLPDLPVDLKTHARVDFGNHLQVGLLGQGFVGCGELEGGELYLLLTPKQLLLLIQ